MFVVHNETGIERSVNIVGSVTPLRAAVLAKFRSVHAFAEALKWSDGKAFRIVNGVQSPTASEICAMRLCLQIEDPAETLRIFSLD